jgi:hypothetical protein
MADSNIFRGVNSIKFNQRFKDDNDCLDCEFVRIGETDPTNTNPKSHPVPITITNL